MVKSSLETFAEQIKSGWGPLTTGVVESCRESLHALLESSAQEPWLARLLRDLPETSELHRNPEAGYVLLAHAEHSGRYRAPHDHGRGWVIYGLLKGAAEVGTYMRTELAEGDFRLVRRETYRMRPGECRVYLPGDIHDTRCVSQTTLMFRFTSRDLMQEEREGFVRRYVEQDGRWRMGRS